MPVFKEDSGLQPGLIDGKCLPDIGFVGGIDPANTHIQGEDIEVPQFFFRKESCMTGDAFLQHEESFSIVGFGQGLVACVPGGYSGIVGKVPIPDQADRFLQVGDGTVGREERGLGQLGATLLQTDDGDHDAEVAEQLAGMIGAFTAQHAVVVKDQGFEVHGFPKVGGTAVS